MYINQEKYLFEGINISFNLCIQDMVGVPQKFPSPEKDEDVVDGDGIKNASCEELVMTGIAQPNQRKTIVSVFEGSVKKKYI